jgi:D-ribose pyranase
MKKGRILNKKLNTAIADMGHGDILIIGDAGFPIAKEEQRVDLAIEQDVPGVIQILDLIMSDFIYEKVIVAEEQKLYNPLHFKNVCELSDRCGVETVPHEEIIAKYAKEAKYIVRTGAFEPWGNIILVSGINAAAYFQKEGSIAPDYYTERVNYGE